MCVFVIVLGTRLNIKKKTLKSLSSMNAGRVIWHHGKHVGGSPAKTFLQPCTFYVSTSSAEAAPSKWNLSSAALIGTQSLRMSRWKRPTLKEEEHAMNFGENIHQSNVVEIRNLYKLQKPTGSSCNNGSTSSSSYSFILRSQLKKIRNDKLINVWWV